MIRPGRALSAVQRLDRMATGARVELWCGSVFVKAHTAWQRAGTCGAPISSRELVLMNGGVTPTTLVPLWESIGEVA